MSNHIEGSLDGSGLMIGIVAAKFNEFITTKLVEGAEEGLSENGVDVTDVTIAYVPGSFEIPVVASKMAHSGNYDAVICLGAVIKGDTDHYEYVAGEATRGIADVSLSSGIPVIFGVLTTETISQALDRSIKKDKGYEVMDSAFYMIDTFKDLNKWRGESDFQAFRHLFHKKNKDFQLTLPARMIFNELEIARV